MIVLLHRMVTTLALLVACFAITACDSSTDDKLTANDQYTITGVVTDEAGLPLIGASVLVENTTTGTITDMDGTFEMWVSEDDVDLRVSYTGYAHETVSVDDAGGDALKITMHKQ